jgi:CRISPR system Cascade subunit CasC
MLIEIGHRQPRTLANAFLNPVPLKGDIAAKARESLLNELVTIDANFGPHEVRRIMLRKDADSRSITPNTLQELADFAKKATIAAQA